MKEWGIDHQITAQAETACPQTRILSGGTQTRPDFISCQVADLALQEVLDRLVHDATYSIDHSASERAWPETGIDMG